jgi:hypothetical protein
LVKNLFAVKGGVDGSPVLPPTAVRSTLGTNPVSLRHSELSAGNLQGVAVEVKRKRVCCRVAQLESVELSSYTLRYNGVLTARLVALDPEFNPGSDLIREREDEIVGIGLG